MIPITAYYAIPIALLAIGLSTHVSMERGRTKTMMGDGGHRALALRVRRHGNLVETAPLALILMLLAEMAGAAPLGLHLAGVALVTGRLLHVVGMSDERLTAGRLAGGTLTSLSQLISIGTIALAGWS